MLDVTYHNAIDMVIDKLKNEGFGVLTKIDVKDKFKEKLGIDYKNHENLKTTDRTWISNLDMEM